MWHYQGSRTLAWFLRQRDFAASAADAFGMDPDQVSEAEVVKEVVRQVLRSMAGLHSAGIVHRDIKPHNMVSSLHAPCSASALNAFLWQLFDEKERRFKLIDLGACIDVKLGRYRWGCSCVAGLPRA